MRHAVLGGGTLNESFSVATVSSDSSHRSTPVVGFRAAEESHRQLLEASRACAGAGSSSGALFGDLIGLHGLILGVNATVCAVASGLFQIPSHYKQEDYS